MAFDFEGAAKEGYTPSEINQYLAEKHGFDYQGALDAGHTDDDILAHLGAKEGADLSPAPLVPYDRGIVGDVISHGARGLVEAGSQVAGAMRLADASVSEDTGVIAKAGSALQGGIDYARQNFDILKPDQGEVKGEESIVKRGAMGAIESTPASLVPMAGALVGAAAGSALGPVGTVAGGIIGGGLSLFGTFGLGQYQNTYDETKKQLARKGVVGDEAETIAKDYAMTKAAAEVGGEMAGDLAAFATFGMGKTLFGQPLKAVIKGTLDGSVKNLYKTGAKQFAKEFITDAPFEVGSEMGTAYIEAKKAKELNLSDQTTGEAMGEAVLPAAFMSLIFGGSIHGMDMLKAKNLLDRLNSNDQKARFDAAIEVASRIKAKTEDETIAMSWLGGVSPLIASGVEIPINAPIADYASHNIDGVNSQENARVNAQTSYLRGLNLPTRDLMAMRSNPVEVIDRLGLDPAQMDAMRPMDIDALLDERYAQMNEAHAFQDNGGPLSKAASQVILRPYDEMDKRALEQDRQRRQTQEQTDKSAAERLVGDYWKNTLKTPAPREWRADIDITAEDAAKYQDVVKAYLQKINAKTGGPIDVLPTEVKPTTERPTDQAQPPQGNDEQEEPPGPPSPPPPGPMPPTGPTPPAPDGGISGDNDQESRDVTPEVPYTNAEPAVTPAENSLPREAWQIPRAEFVGEDTADNTKYRTAAEKLFAAAKAKGFVEEGGAETPRLTPDEVRKALKGTGLSELDFKTGLNGFATLRDGVGMYSGQFLLTRAPHPREEGHAVGVMEALQQNKPVTDEVLADYPGWKEKNGPQQAQAQQAPEAEPALAQTPKMAFKENVAKGGIEISFPGASPGMVVTARLKAAGFKWSGRQGLWYAKASPIRRNFATKLHEDLNSPTTQPKTQEDQNNVSEVQQATEQTQGQGDERPGNQDVNGEVQRPAEQEPDASGQEVATTEPQAPKQAPGIEGIEGGALFDEIMSMSADDIANVIQDVAAEGGAMDHVTVGEAKKEKAKLATVATIGQTSNTPRTQAPAPTLAQPAKEIVAGMSDVMKGLAAAFGVDPNKLITFPPTLDEDAYRKARPYFIDGFKKFQAAGKGLAEYVKYVVDSFNAFLPNIKEYIAYFIGELQGKHRFDIDTKKDNTIDNGGVANDLRTDSTSLHEGVQQAGAEADAASGNTGRVPEGRRDGLPGPGGLNRPADDRGGPAGGISAEGASSQSGEVHGEGGLHERPDGVPGKLQGAGTEVGGETVSGDQAGTTGHGPGRGADVSELADEERPQGDPGRGKPATQPVPVGQNYRITDSDNLGKGGAKQKAKDNIAAIRVLKQLQAENRAATPAEQAILVKYVGWGASELANNMFPVRQWDRASGSYQINYEPSWAPLAGQLTQLLTPKELEAAKASTINAHYTSQAVISSMYKALERFGFKDGRILEPGAGIGNFIGLIPENMLAKTKFSAVELDPITAGIAKALYPGHDVRSADFAKYKAPDDFFDVVIGNPPFSDMKVTTDPDYAARRYSLHDFFVVKSLDKLRPGGVMILVTSRYTMDKSDSEARTQIAKKADLIGAIRLPQTAFKENAGTEVVTDVLFFRKRKQGEQKSDLAWDAIKAVDTDNISKQGYVNEYYINHPEMVLGNHSMTGSMYGSNQYTVTPKPGNIESQFASAIENMPSDLYSPDKAKVPTPKEVAVADFAPENIKEGAFFEDGKGNILKKEHGVGIDAGIAKNHIPKVKHLVRIRDAVRKVLFVQLAQGSDAELAAAQRKLTNEYNAFVKAFGPINKESRSSAISKKTGKTIETIRYPNWTPFKSDPDSYLVAGIEHYNYETDEVTKADIFTKRVIAPTVEPKVESLEDALHVSLHSTGGVDIEKIAGLMGVTEDQAIDGLGLAIFDDPSEHKWVTSDEYLSGNVRKKLASARAAAEVDPKFARNVSALEDVQPADLPPSKILVDLGMPILSEADIQDFAHSVLHMTIDVNHLAANGSWALKYRGGQASTQATSVFGTNRRHAGELLDAALNSSPIKIYDTIREPDGGTSRVFNKDATERANAKLREIKTRFATWIWEDADRADRIARAYNDAYNNIVKREYGGEHIAKMQFPGISAAKTPREHQKRVAWRIIQKGNTYMAHSVGAGKTIASIIAGMEMKRLGIKKKPMWVVPNHMLKQFSGEFLELYPAAKLLVADEEQFSKENRNRFMGKVATENWDGIIITHSAFQKIPLSPEEAAQFIQEELDEYADILTMTHDRIRRKQVEAAIRKLRERLGKLLEGQGRDRGVTFEETGIDQLFVDEAQEFRKLSFSTSQSDLKGVSADGSMMAGDLYSKARYLERLYPGRSLVLMSGTPITNTIGELFSIQRFLQGPLLRENNLHNFDAWAATFADSVSAIEGSPAGHKMVTRLGDFKNIAALSAMWSEIGDFVHAKDLPEIKRPDVKGNGRQFVVIPPSDLQRQFQEVLAARIRAIQARKGPPQKGDDIILTVNTDGRHAALDDRYISRGEGLNPGATKIDTVITNVFTIWESTKNDRKTQMIFSDLGVAGSEERRGFSAYVFIKEELMKRGVPEKEIAFMQDFKSSEEKKKLFKRVNNGDVRVLIGSSESMGTGVNAQERLVALHHIDPNSYLPANIEQREGRILRQGNKNSEIEIYAYAAKGSFDEQMWQFLERKQRFIEKFLAGEATEGRVSDVAGDADSYAMAKALSSSNPLVIEKAEAEHVLQRLESLYRAHVDDQRTLARKKAQSVHNLKTLAEQRAEAVVAAEAVVDISGDKFTVQIGDKTFDNREEAGNAWKEVLAPFVDGTGAIVPYRAIGRMVGGKVEAHTPGSPLVWGGVRLVVAGVPSQTITLTKDELENADPHGLAVRIENLAKSFAKEIASIDKEMPKQRQNIEDIDALLGKPFEKTAEMEAKRARIKAIDAELLAQNQQAHSGGTNDQDLDTEEEDENGLSDMDEPQTLEATAASLGKQVEPFRVNMGDRREDVSGILVEMQEAPGIQLFAHFNVGGPTGWVVSEVSTGLKISRDPSAGYGEAVALAEARIKEIGIDQVRATIDSTPKISDMKESREVGGLSKPQSTVEQVKRLLYKSLSIKGLTNLTKAGKLMIVQTEAELAGYTQSKKDAEGRVLGAYHNGTVYLVADNLTAENTHGVLLHEMVHAEIAKNGWQGLLGDNYDMLKRQVERMLEAGHDGLVAAQNKAKAAGVTGPALFEETVTYFVQGRANQETSLFRRILRAINAWALRVGLRTQIIADDLVGLAESSLRRAEKKISAGLNPILGENISQAVPTYSIGPVTTEIAMNRAKRLLTPGLGIVKGVKDGAQSLLLPSAKSPEHLAAAVIIGKHLGVMHHNQELAITVIKPLSAYFDKAGVFNPNIPLNENLGVRFMSDMSQGRPMNPELQAISEKVDALFQNRLEQLEAAGAPLKTVRENYFPGMWTEESRRAFNQAIGEAIEEGEGGKDLATYTDAQKAWVKDRVETLLKNGKGTDKDGLQYLAKRPFKGSESFRKAKVFDDIMTGIDLGLKPISVNPLDMVKLKLSEMDRSIMANSAMGDFKAQGLVKFSPVHEQVPEGWVRINDKYGIVYGPPTVGLHEYVDKNVYDGLMSVAKDMGLDVKRPLSAGRGKLGYAEMPPFKGTIAQFATELSVLAHEIGHQLDFKYDLWTKIVDGAQGYGVKGNVTKTASQAQRGLLQKELRTLADLTWEETQASENYKKKVRKKAEKMAHMLEAYIHAPEKFREVAPNVFTAFDEFVRSVPEIERLAEIKQGLALQELHNEKYVGLPILGYRIATTPVADILNNYLSSSLYNNQYFGKLYKAHMSVANALNQAQLVGGFHAGFTSLETQITSVAAVIKDVYGLLRGTRTTGQLATTMARVPGAMYTTQRLGGRVIHEWRNPDATISPQMAMIVKAVELAGGGFKMERGLQTEQRTAMVRDWHAGKKFKAALRSPVAALEYIAWPIMEFLVPRQKAGVFAEMAGRIIEQHPGVPLEDLAAEFRSAWNRVDARLGQVRYDRLFLNNTAKNVVQALVRAPGWTGGTLAEVGGSFKDTAKFLKEWQATGKLPAELPDRVAYTLSLVMTTAVLNVLLTFLFTGEEPEDWKDLMTFKTGGVDEHGNPERFILPSYMKDLYAYSRAPLTTISHKMHPMLALGGELYRNRDYYGTEIRSEDDAILKQVGQLTGHVVKAFTPFSIRGLQKERERGGNLASQVAPLVGITPSPAALNKTRAEGLMYEYAVDRLPQGSRTKEQAERSRLMNKITVEARRGNMEAAEEAFTEGHGAGLLSLKDFKMAVKGSMRPALVNSFRKLSYDQAEKVFGAATEKEQALLFPYISAKRVLQARKMRERGGTANMGS